MFNWGYEATVPFDVAQLPKQICPRVWVKDLTAGGSSQLQIPCLDMTVMQTSGVVANSMKTGFNGFSSAATFQAEEVTALAATERTRTNLHVVFTVAPVDPTHLLESGGMYSFDGGVSWSSEGTSSYYEQHIEQSKDDSRWYQAWQFDYDKVTTTKVAAPGKSAEPPPSEVCFKVWVTDTVTSETVWLDSGNATSHVRCLQVCDALVPFHWPKGYCPSRDAAPSS